MISVKEQKFIKESFSNGFFKVFDSNDEARKMHALLEKNEVRHEFGDYLHKVGTQQRYNLGIRVQDTRKLQDLINSGPVGTEPEDNPVKDMERLAGQTEPENKSGEEPKEEAAEGTETATQPVGQDAPAQEAKETPAPTQKKRKRNKKVNL